MNNETNTTNNISDDNAPFGINRIPLITFEDHTENLELRNVKDEYRSMFNDEISADIDTKRVPMVSVCMNLTSDFNKASIIRANNAFAGSDVIIAGKKKFDRRGTVGSHHYEHLRHHNDVNVIIDALKEDGYTLFAVDNTPEFNPQVIYDFKFPQKSAFFYGEEQKGLDTDVVAQCDHCIYIPQFGSVRSINVAQAASVVMSEYSRQMRFADNS